LVISKASPPSSLIHHRWAIIITNTDWLVREVAQTRNITNSLVRVASYSFGPATLALVAGVALAVGFGVGFGLGHLVGAKRSVIILRDVGAQEVSARDRFLACSVAQEEPDYDAIFAQWRKLHPPALLRADAGLAFALISLIGRAM